MATLNSYFLCSITHIRFQFDNVLVLLSTYFFDERMYADWGQWNREFKVTAVVRIAIRLAVN